MENKPPSRPRIVRWIWLSCALLSPLLCIATTVVRVRSFYIQDELFWLTSKAAGPQFELTTYELFSVKGRNVFHVRTRSYDAQSLAETLAMYELDAPSAACKSNPARLPPRR